MKSPGNEHCSNLEVCGIATTVFCFCVFTASWRNTSLGRCHANASEKKLLAGCDILRSNRMVVTCCNPGNDGMFTRIYPRVFNWCWISHPSTVSLNHCDIICQAMSVLYPVWSPYYGTASFIPCKLKRLNNWSLNWETGPQAVLLESFP